MSIWGILFCVRQNRKPVSVLTCHLSSRPTPRKRASNSFALADAPIYMVFLVLVPSPPYVAIQRRELLPRGFTLTLIGRSVFCYGLHKITPICDFHSRILYPVRTFLCLKFLMVISSSLLVAHILTTRRLLRYSLLAFLEIPHHKSQTATDRSTLNFPVATAGAVLGSVLNQRQIVLPCFFWRHLLHFCSKNVAGGMFFVGTCYTFVVKT